MKRILLSLALALGIFAIPLPSFATVSSTANTVQYTGDGHSTSFSFNNNVYLASDLNVYEVTAGVSTLLTLNTNYSVSLTAISGVTGAYTATINLAGGSSPAGALAIGTTLVIVRNIPYTQLINISDYSATPAATWNQAHDRGVILSQQLLNLVNRSILQSITATTPITFPLPVASNIIGWDVTGTTLQNYVPNTATYIALPLATSQGGTGSTSITFPLATANGGTGSTAAANAANGVAILNGSAQIPTANLNIGTTASTLVAHDSSGDIEDAPWADYFPSSTIVGWSSPSGNIFYKKIGKLVFVFFEISGTSNTNTVAFTLPYTAYNSGNYYAVEPIGVVIDNGVRTNTPGEVYMIPNSNGATVTRDASGSTNTWTASGTKTVQGQFWYQAQ